MTPGYLILKSILIVFGALLLAGIPLAAGVLISYRRRHRHGRWP